MSCVSPCVPNLLQLQVDTFFEVPDLEMKTQAYTRHSWEHFSLLTLNTDLS